MENPALTLDDTAIYSKLDSQGMLTHIHNFPLLCQEAWELAQTFKLSEDISKVNKIVILGMGGSAIGGDLVGSLLMKESRVPILVCRDYDLPGYVDAETLVIASSYSGQTEETLTSFRQALNTPAKILAITTGGELKTLCLDRHVPVFTFSYKSQPRAALPFSFFILLGLLKNAGIVKNLSNEIASSILQLNRTASKINENVPFVQNTAKAIAGKLHGHLAAIYGAEFTTEVAHRWKTQLNENSKSTAFYEFLSELNHNSVVGYAFPANLPRNMQVIFLDSIFLHKRIRLRIDITQQLLDKAGIPYYRLQGEGDSPLSQMMTLILMGEYVSYYLAILNQADPTTIQAIDYLKNSLAVQ
jgi:glucose/mannose-6-phosphate isomerase